jgi:hypothetical protein
MGSGGRAAVGGQRGLASLESLERGLAVVELRVEQRSVSGDGKGNRRWSSSPIYLWFLPWPKFLARASINKVRGEGERIRAVASMLVSTLK